MHSTKKMAVKNHPETSRNSVMLGVRFSWTSDIYRILRIMQVMMNFSN